MFTDISELATRGARKTVSLIQHTVQFYL